MGSGSVNHATGTLDMRLMGGLRKTDCPGLRTPFLIRFFKLAGIWPLAGFWSKDEILSPLSRRAGTLYSGNDYGVPDRLLYVSAPFS